MYKNSIKDYTNVGLQPCDTDCLAPNAQVGQRLRLQHNTAELTITQ